MNDDADPSAVCALLREALAYMVNAYMKPQGTHTDSERQHAESLAAYKAGIAMGIYDRLHEQGKL